MSETLGILKALADDTRLKILRALSERDMYVELLAERIAAKRRHGVVSYVEAAGGGSGGLAQGAVLYRIFAEEGCVEYDAE